MGINTTAHYYNHDEGESVVVEREGDILFQLHALNTDIASPASIKELADAFGKVITLMDNNRGGYNIHTYGITFKGDAYGDVDDIENPDD